MRYIRSFFPYFHIITLTTIGLTSDCKAPVTMSSPSPTFPTELAEFIIDHVYWADCGPSFDYETHCSLASAKHRTLLACSLVSRAWLPRSRIHLFSIVNLNSSNDSITRFIDLVQNPTQTLTPYIRDLTFSDSRHWADPYAYDSIKKHSDFDIRETWHGRDLPLLLSGLSSLERLSLYNVSFQSAVLESGAGAGASVEGGGGGGGGAVALLSSFPCLKMLDLQSQCAFDSKEHFFECISAVGRSSVLEDLSLGPIECTRNTFKLTVESRVRQKRMAKSKGDSEWAYPRPPTPLAPSPGTSLDVWPPPPIHLKSLRFQMGHAESLGINLIEDVTKWFSSIDSPPNVQTVYGESLWDEQVVPLASYVQALTGSLRRLGIGFFSSAQAAEFTRNVDLSKHQHLESIKFQFIDLNSPSLDVPHSADHIYPLLDQIASSSSSPSALPSKKMKEIWLHVRINQPEDLNLLNWEELRRILHKEAFRDLERFVVEDGFNGLSKDKDTVEETKKFIDECLRVGPGKERSRSIVQVYTKESEDHMDMQAEVDKRAVSEDMRARWKMRNAFDQAQAKKDEEEFNAGDFLFA
ncbi:hypothetical protein D9758_009036 [Tetrapyrgos nigripes]|uniref:Uncharacterized protein n=1 Tax=Tetrapyrgos nigripes TaxID=182062 RepID=A0A8H5GA57_9AGAR|nr:hypothetical protein D9758_009036 [Tetrapyrgos nigripes]